MTTNKNGNYYLNEVYTEVDGEDSVIFGRSGWFESFTDKLSILLNGLKKEHGRIISKIYVDTIDGKVKTAGYVFEKIDKYDDTKEKYKKQTWVEISTTAPKHVEYYESVNYIN